MNENEIKARLRELNSQKYLSDDEVEEKDRLIEELAILRNGARKPEQKPQLVKIDTKTNQNQQREHTVIGKAISKGFKLLAEHFKEKPVTMEEIEELKKQAVKYRLKADVEKSKASIRKSKENRFGSFSGPTQRTSSKSNRNNNYEDKVERILRGAVRPSKTHGTDIRKAFYG